MTAPAPDFEASIRQVCERMTQLAEAHSYAIQVLARIAGGEVEPREEAMRALRATPSFFDLDLS